MPWASSGELLFSDSPFVLSFMERVPNNVAFSHQLVKGTLGYSAQWLVPEVDNILFSSEGFPDRSYL
jgi:hypothetical protein